MTIQDSLHRPEFLKSSGIPVWIVVTGNVRSGREFRGIFSKILALRDSGLVDGIRFVTWHGELESAPGLEQTLVALGISILTIQEPVAEPKVHPLFHGFVYHQRKALHFALESLPENSYVLKARTDFAEERFDSMVDALFRNPSLDLEIGIPNPILKTRLFSFDARPDYLFYWDDIVFSGLRDDLLRLNNFDLSSEFIYPGHVFPAECRLFAPLFLDHYPVLRWFFENIDGREFSELLQLWISNDQEITLPALIRNVLASYLHILSRYVLLPSAESTSPLPIQLKNFFTESEKVGVKSFLHPWSSHKLYSQILLDRLLNGELFEDKELGEVTTLMRQMDDDVASRGVMPIKMEESLLELVTFAGRFGLHLFTSQTRLIPSAATLPLHSSSLLDLIELPEKRHLSWWKQKYTGLRRSAAKYLIRKLL